MIVRHLLIAASFPCSWCCCLKFPLSTQKIVTDVELPEQRLCRAPASVSEVDILGGGSGEVDGESGICCLLVNTYFLYGVSHSLADESVNSPRYAKGSKFARR